MSAHSGRSGLVLSELGPVSSEGAPRPGLPSPIPRGAKPRCAGRASLPVARHAHPGRPTTQPLAPSALPARLAMVGIGVIPHLPCSCRRVRCRTGLAGMARGAPADRLEAFGAASPGHGPWGLPSGGSAAGQTFPLRAFELHCASGPIKKTDTCLRISQTPNRSRGFRVRSYRPAVRWFLPAIDPFEAVGIFTNIKTIR